MARVNYDLQLKDLKNQMLLLGSMIEETIQETIHALMAQDSEQAKKIASSDEKIDDQVHRIERICYNLLLRQQPVARDLRCVSAAQYIVNDMERIGDHGTDISELTVLMSEEKYPKEIFIIEEMAKEAMVMLIEAVDAFAEENLHNAKVVIKKDDVVDKLFLDVKNAIAQAIQSGEANATQALDLLMVAKYLERIGDHATNIAEWVVFYVNGELPED